MNYEHEFGIVDFIIKSEFKTRAVDAFTLSLIKVERQVRRIFTYLIYQHPNYSEHDASDLRRTLADNKNIYFNSFINGINTIYANPVKQVYGNGYDSDLEELKSIINYRNKIFHGQLTNDSLSRSQLISMVEVMKRWSKTVATNFTAEIYYDGFGRNSYQKSNTQIVLNNHEDFSTMEKYKAFLNTLKR